MPKFVIQVERTYTARHIGSVEVVADTLDDALEKAEAGLEADELDPTDRFYSNTHDSEGYDSAGSWELSEDGHHELPADAPSWAGLGGGCKVCGDTHYSSNPCVGA